MSRQRQAAVSLHDSPAARAERARRQGSAASALALQGAAGNQAVARLLAGATPDHRSSCGCGACLLTADRSLQRVRIPTQEGSAHKAGDARQYVRERDYAGSPAVSSGQSARTGYCGACGMTHYMSNLQVDHMVPEALLDQLLRMFNDGEDQVAVNVAGILSLDWTESIDIDRTQADAISSWRERMETYVDEQPEEFVGHRYQAVNDVDNMWLLCPTCNGRRGKTDRLLLSDYEELNDFAGNVQDDAELTALLQAYLGRWIGTDYYWDPDAAEADLDIPNSPGYAEPEKAVF